jgi:hypothetical protein
MWIVSFYLHLEESARLSIAENAHNIGLHRRVGFCGAYGKNFPRFEFFLLPSRVHAPP